MITPEKTPTALLDPAQDADLIYEYILHWITEAERQIPGKSSEVGSDRLEAVVELIREHVQVPFINNRSTATTMARLVYASVARSLPPHTRTHGQVKI